MTISSSIRKAGPFTGNGVTVAFPFYYKVFSAADVLVVQAVTAAGVETTKVLTTDYTVSLNADQNANPGGTVTMLVAPPTGQTLTLGSKVGNLQPTDLTNFGGFYPTVINDSLDRSAIQIQQIAEKLDRAVTLPISSTESPANYFTLVTSAANTSAINASNSAISASTAYNSAVSSALSASASSNSAGESAVSANRAVAAWAASTAPTEQLASISTNIHFGAVVKSIVYDTSKDSDGGAWRKRCADKSWYTETAGVDIWLGQRASASAAWAVPGASNGAYFQNTTDGKFYRLNGTSPNVVEVFRGNSREFPAQVAIVAETARVVIYDLTQVACPMWMVFTTNGAINMIGGQLPLTSIAALNGSIHIGHGGTGWGLASISFLKDNRILYFGSSIYTYLGAISDRNNGKNHSQFTTANPPINVVVNDVGITVLDTAPIDPATGLPVPTIAVATAGGVSVIKDDGTVVNSSATAPVIKTVFTLGGNFWWANNANTTFFTVGAPSTASFVGIGMTGAGSGTITSACPIGALSVSALANAGRATDAFGSTNGLAVLRKNISSNTGNMVSYITNAYNSGWLPGDIRGAYLADTVAETITSANPQADRSVKNNSISVVGSLTKTAVASGAALVAYSGFSASNYLEQTYSANLDFGTGETDRLTWIKFSATAAKEVIWCRDSATTGVLSRLQVDVTTSVLSFTMFDGTTTRTATGTTAIDDGVWHLVETKYSAGTLTILVDGNAYATATGAALLTMNNATAVSRIGIDCQGANSASSGSITLARVSSTATSTDQSQHIYRTELPLFQGNAQCTIAGTSTAVTALAYDDVADTLHVGTSWGRSGFRDLLRVDSDATTTGAITSLSANEGVVITGGASSAKAYAPAMYLRDELRRKDVARKALGRIPAFFDYTATASQTAFVAPKGFTIKALYKNGTLMRETTTGVYWTRSNDGFQETATLSVGATVSDWISLMCVRT